MVSLIFPSLCCVISRSSHRKRVQTCAGGTSMEMCRRGTNFAFSYTHYFMDDTLTKAKLFRLIPLQKNTPADTAMQCYFITETVTCIVWITHIVTFFSFIHVSLDVAQVWAVFKPKSKGILPAYLAATPLCYVHYFWIFPLLVGQECIGLHQVECMDSLISPPTGVILLMHVVRLLDLIPVFNTTFSDIPPSRKMCMKSYVCYYLNTFSDKETFHTLHHWSP